MEKEDGDKKEEKKLYLGLEISTQQVWIEYRELLNESHPSFFSKDNPVSV